MNPTSQSKLIRSLQDPEVYDHQVEAVQVIETHISWVLLTGEYAYKIKKPVDFGFVDFTTLGKRRFFCQEELRLNRRLAASLYLDVVAITGSPGHPAVNGTGTPIEFAVKMKQFPQQAMLSHLLEQGRVTAAHIDGLAHEVAQFHGRIDMAAPHTPFGTPERVDDPVQENFQHLTLATGDEPHHRQVQRLHDWSQREFAARRADFDLRKTTGFVRECHGDMHLANMVLLENRVTIFDCIEFNESFRWIDVLSEAAFVVMDLEDRGRPDLAHRFLNAYLEITGDYRGLCVLPFYLTYRALVRAKIACLRVEQSGASAGERDRLRSEFVSYLELAERYTKSQRPLLVITHGLSGSGKTVGTQPLVDRLGAIRIRSDVERKRRFVRDAQTRSQSAVGDGRYSNTATRKTYARLAELSAASIRAGFSVVVDATFLQQSRRDEFRRLAEQLSVGFIILDFRARDEVLRQRIVRRRHEGRDASEANLAVLDEQLKIREPLTTDEQPFVVPVDSEDPHAADHCVATVERRRGSDSENSVC